MRHYDYAPLFRSTVGFDRLFNLLDGAHQSDSGSSYPPYNIEQSDENAYRITMAVAGFAEDDLSIEWRNNTLTITGKQDERSGSGRTYLHRGIAERGFERRFQLADHVRVAGARLEHGLLNVDLVRELPEQLKPRQVPIATNANSKAIDNPSTEAA